MKYAPKKVYVKENGEYAEIEYDMFCKMRKNAEWHNGRFFVPLQGYLLETDKDSYDKFYGEIERNKYLGRLDVENGLVSMDDVVNDKENALSTSISTRSDETEHTVIINILVEKLYGALKILEADERNLINLIYYKCMSQREAAQLLGISRTTLEYRLNIIIEKLRNHIEG